MKTVQIKIPTSGDDINYLLTSLKYKLKRYGDHIRYRINGGWRCPDTGIVVPFRGNNTVIEGNVSGTKMMLSYYSDHTYAPHALFERIRKYFELTTPSEAVCSFTRKFSPCISTISKFDDQLAKDLDLDIRFGSTWWNGHQASLEAFRTLLLETGEIKSNVISVQDGQALYNVGAGKIARQPVPVKDLIGDYGACRST
jgi:hypothetical protein